MRGEAPVAPRAAPGKADAILAALRGRLIGVEVLEPADARVRGDHDLNPGLTDWGPGSPEAPRSLRAAAVLVPLIAPPPGQLDHDGHRAGGLGLLLTRRSAHLDVHAGQISFPGGRIEPEDASPAAAALRETREEIGLAPEQVEVIGRLDTYITRTGFRVIPVVGVVRPPFTVRPDPHEVAEVFEIPLARLLAPGLPEHHTRLFMGVARHFYAFPCQGHFIWGATAGMLVDLRERLLGLGTGEGPGEGAPL